MKKNLIKFVPTFLFLVFPFIAFADDKDLKYVVKIIIDYLNIGIYLIISLAVVTFVWNVYRYFFTEKDKKEAGMYVLYSTIGFFVILSLWGLVAIISNSLKLPNNQPSWPFGGSSTGGTSFPSNPTPNNNGTTLPSNPSNYTPPMPNRGNDRLTPTMTPLP